MSSDWMTTRLTSAETPDGSTQVFRSGQHAAPDGVQIPTDLAREDLLALLRSELCRSHHERQPFPIERFRSWLDKAGATADDWLNLIVAELRLRHEFGSLATLEEYVKRFPELAPRIRDAFAQAALLDGDTPARRDDRSASSLLALFQSPSGNSTMKAGGAPAYDSIPTTMSVIVPGYEILGVLGRGGMGVVFKARQNGLNRLVALKMILAGSHAKADDLARFRQEAEAVAALHHPNIVQIYDIGEHDGMPYFSMEYVDGGTLARTIAGQPQPAAFACETAEALARAIHVAHRQNIIHRDLKPANVLLTAGSGMRHADSKTENAGLRTESSSSRIPNSECHIPKITDFGLAKRLDSALQLTTSGLVAGTPQYMAPEQVGRGGPQAVGPAADIYSVGVILYEMLTGRPPFLGSTPAEIMNQVLHHEPVPIQELQPNAPRDLETICLKCLQKEPHKRYATADDLAEDLRRFRGSQPIRARPVGKVEQVIRWCRRNRAVSSLILLVTLTLTAGAGIATYFALDAAEHARRAEQNERAALQQELAAVRAAEELRHEQEEVQAAHRQLTTAHKKLTVALEDASLSRQEEERLKKEAVERENYRARELYDAQMIQAHRAWETGHVAQTRRLLAQHEPVRDDQTDHRAFEWHYLARLSNSEGTRFSVPEGCHSMAISPDGAQIIWASRNTCEIWSSAQPPMRLGVLEGHKAAVERVAYDPTGQRIATCSRDKSIKIWDAANWQLLQTIPQLPFAALSIRFSPHGQFIAAVMSDPGRNLVSQLAVWDVKSGDKKWSVDSHAKATYDLAYSDDAALIATAGHDECVKIWDAASGELKANLPLSRGASGRSVAFAPQGNLLAAGTTQGEILVWDRETWKEERRLRGHVNAVNALVFAADGHGLASAGNDQLLKIWDADTGTERRTFRGHTQSLADVHWLPKRPTVYTVSLDQSIKGWDVSDDPERFTMNSRTEVANLHLLPDGRRVAVAGTRGIVAVWDSRLGIRVAECSLPEGGRGPIWNSSLAPDGQSMVFTRSVQDESYADVLTWDLKDAKARSLQLSGLAHGVGAIAHSSDGRRLATGHHNGTVQVHSLDRPSEPIAWQVGARSIAQVLFVPGDPNRLLVVAHDLPPRLYDIRQKKVIYQFLGHHKPPRAAAFSSDGLWLATGSADQSARVWNASTGEEVFKLEGHTGPVRCVAFSPESDRLLTGSEDSTLKLWDLRTGHETLTLNGHKREVTQAFFAPDGRRIFSAGLDWTIKVWDAGPVRDREMLRAAASVWRLASFRLDGELRTGETVDVQAELTNVSGKVFPMPPPRKARTAHRTVLRLFATPIRNGALVPEKTVMLGRTDFLPETSIEADYRRDESFEVSLQSLQPGRYRLRLEHGWWGNDFMLIDDKALDVTVAAK